MDTLPKIRTPWKQQFRRIRYQLLPVISMGLAVLATAFLWNRHVGTVDGVGEVVAEEKNVICSADGTLIGIPSGHDLMKMHVPVRNGQLLARVASTPDTQGLADLRRDVAKLLAQLRADGSSATTRPSAAHAAHVDIQFQRLEIIDLRAVHRLEPPLTDTFNGTEIALQRLRRKLETSQNDAPPMPADMQSKVVAVDALWARMDNLDFPEIRSPLEGDVIQVQRYLGQPVSRGLLIATVAATEAHTVLCYVRQEQNIQPRAGEYVEVRTRQPGRGPLEGLVDRTGRRAESVPLHQLRDQKVREFGTPVYITVNEEMHLRPGYLVDVRFKNHAAQ